jgi:hypothetical protein
MILGLNTEKRRFLRDVQDVQKFALIRTGVSQPYHCSGSLHQARAYPTTVTATKTSGWPRFCADRLVALVPQKRLLALFVGPSYIFFKKYDCL